MIRSLYALAAMFLLVLLPAQVFGIVQGHVDDFEDGTIDGWSDRHVDNTVNIPDGGPRGVGDHYLQLTSGTGGSDRMAMINTASWLNDFVAADVTGLTMDLKNFGTSSLPIRIAIRESSGGPSTPGYVTTQAYMLPADGQWHLGIPFLLDASSLTPINMPMPLSTDLANVADFRILSSVVPSTLGDPIDAQIGLDNITAIPSGDFNRDGHTTSADISAMMTALADLNGYQSTNSLTSDQLLQIGDLSGDGQLTNADVQSLIVAIANAGGAGSLSAVPEPESIVLFALAAGFSVLIAKHSAWSKAAGS